MQLKGAQKTFVPKPVGRKFNMEKRLVAAGCNCQAIYNKSSGIPIIFLHGLSYTIEVWQRISVLNALMEKKISFLALDMPYGQKS